MQYEVKKYLKDIYNALSELEEFTKGKKFTDFVKDRGLQLIVERELEIVGEALNKIRKIEGEIEKSIPDIPKIIALRNVIIHGYASIDYEILWDIVENKVASFKQSISAMLWGGNLP